MLWNEMIGFDNGVGYVLLIIWSSFVLWSHQQWLSEFWTPNPRGNTWLVSHWAQQYITLSVLCFSIVTLICTIDQLALNSWLIALYLIPEWSLIFTIRRFHSILKFRTLDNSLGPFKQPLPKIYKKCEECGTNRWAQKQECGVFSCSTFTGNIYVVWSKFSL